MDNEVFCQPVGRGSGEAQCRDESMCNCVSSDEGAMTYGYGEHAISLSAHSSVRLESKDVPTLSTQHFEEMAAVGAGAFWGWCVVIPYRRLNSFIECVVIAGFIFDEDKCNSFALRGREVASIKFFRCPTFDDQDVRAEIVVVKA